MKNTSHHPTVSVLMPVYNAELFLREAIESVLNQSFTDFELLIINDGSTDKSKTIIESYKDSRIRLVNQPNHGLVYTLNKGIDLAEGKYIARMDADDASLPNRLERQVDFLEVNTEVALLGTAYDVVDEEGAKLYTFKPILDDSTIRLDFLLRNPFGHGTTMFRKEVVQKLGGYANLRYTEDYELWWRIASKHKLANIQDILYKWRVVSSSMSHAKHLENQKIIVSLKGKIWSQSQPVKIKRIHLSGDSTTKRTYLNMYIALSYFLMSKGLSKEAMKLKMIILTTLPNSLRQFREARQNQLVEGYDIRRICSDARGEIYDK